MSFTFGFQIHDEDREEGDVTSSCQTSKVELPDTTECPPPPLPAKEIPVSPSELLQPAATSQLRLDGGKVLSYVTAPQSKSLEASTSESDLVPNVYEGGMKIWECSVDLVEYLSEIALSWAGLKVLEIGCGAGLPGILALTKGAEKVHFLDYNEEVLRNVTIPNVVLNAGTDLDATRCRFFAGDWSSVQKLLTEESKCANDLTKESNSKSGNKMTEESKSNEKYDVILTSETIYNTDSYQKLHDLMKSTLAPHGTIYLAAKTHYFGVGGGTRLFEEFVRKEDVFRSEVSKVYSEGVNREILKIEIKKS
ncbi:PREDICTED: histidine protein methyltransferase 1 homolog [Branchiostoma belcheri]|uniref:protein-histidine N-methyltransferase n=1 Tax=Branchiostoma belcheri TaxID=7741 RepID=A0A6P5AXH1_BRABE|nr:PREDICTED: histidine protein methyltransferase 1 homolog [Branchiostoma belcheri]